MLMYDVLQVGGIFKLSSFVWRAPANLSWGCHWWMRGRSGGRGQHPDAGLWWQWGEQTRDGTRIVVLRQNWDTFTTCPGQEEVSRGGGGARNVFTVHPGVICSTMFGKWWIKRVKLATPDRIQHPVDTTQQALPWAQQILYNFKGIKGGDW